MVVLSCARARRSLALVALMITIVAAKSVSFPKDFFELTNRSEIRSNLEYLTSFPHIAGSIEDFETAEWLLQKFKDFGLEDSWIETFDVLLSLPVRRRVEIVYPETLRFVANLTEPGLSVDPTSGDQRVVPTFNGYAPSGNVTAELVYVNYGTTEDFESLTDSGLNLTGKIGIVRYGFMDRTKKVLNAQDFGLIGLLIYSDPLDDGFLNGPVYPEGAFRPEFGVQRGGVLFVTVCPGDPSRPDACLDDPETDYVGTVIPSIPVQPISWGDAQPLLRGLGGPPCEASWQGGLNFTYHVGPGPVIVNIELEMNFTHRPIWNVMAQISGNSSTNHTVLVGNHRDAWVFGASDPSSGTAALVEMARTFGILLKKGWQPKRNILFGSWDGEEYGYLGAVAYAEKYARELQETVVAYINVDIAVGGQFMSAGGTQSFAELVGDVFKAVPYESTIWANFSTVYESWDKTLNVLGAGSDFIAFLHPFGISTIDIGFRGLSAGTYHSIYDSFHMMDTIMDPGFYLHEATTRAYGLIVEKIADSVLLPHNFLDYANDLADYAQKVEILANGTEKLDFSALNRSIELFKEKSEYLKFQTNCLNDPDNVTTSAYACESLSIDELNDRMMRVEKGFLYARGLPGRKYFKHVVQAPAMRNGYVADTFPGLTQMILEEQWAQADFQLTAIVECIANAAYAMQPIPVENKDPSILGIVIGVVIGGLAFLTAVALIIFWLHKSTAEKKVYAQI